MSCCFLWVSHPQGFKPWGQRERDQLSAWVPFEVEREQVCQHPSGKVSALVWETHAEGARGAYYAEAHGGEGGARALSLTGWWREPDEAPLELSSAAVALSALFGRRTSAQMSQGYERGLADFAPEGGWREASRGAGAQLSEALNALHLSPGQFACALTDERGELFGVNSAFCGVPLYYAQHELEREGQRARVAVISNRASLISTLIEGGAPASPRAEVLGWLLARPEHPIGDDEVAYPHVSRLHAGSRVSAYEGALSVSEVLLPSAQRVSERALFEALLWRAEALKRYPKVPLTMALTGGFDSRLVLASLIATDQVGRVERFYINAHPQHADTRSAQRLADHYKLPFFIDPPGRAQDPDEPLLSRLRRHNHLVEHLCSAWDIVSGPPCGSLPTRSLLPGHYGELYRGHAKPVMSQAWWLFTPFYVRSGFIDRHSLLSRELIERYQGLSGAWFQGERALGVPANLALDRLHQHTRMEGWISQCHPIEALGLPSFALLPCVTTRAHYEATSLRERQRPSVHYALTRRADDELWRLPFANSPWPKALYQAEALSPEPPLKGGGTELGYQRVLWRREGEELGAWLLNTPSSSELWRVLSKDKLQAKLTLTKAKPNAQRVKSLMCACAIKLSLSEPAQPTKLKRPSLEG